MSNILRVFPRKTNATPIDNYVAFSFIPRDDIDEVHISVAFTYDMPKAEALYDQYSRYYPTKIGGPAFNQPAGEFIPGMYLKQGYVITSRGCPNHCWFCAVPKREYNGLHELEIKDGWNVLDDNLLACSKEHITKVFDMLKRQKEKIRFTGGLEAKIFNSWHCELLSSIRLERMFFAYDTPDDYEPLVYTSRLLKEYNMLKSRQVSVYCLIGYPNDTFEKAEERLMSIIKLNMCPYAMLWKDKDGKVSHDWSSFQRLWVSPRIIYTRFRGVLD